MSDEPLPRSQIVLYQTEDGRTRVQCRFSNETLWLTQAQIAELFEVTVPNVNIHLKAIYAEGELAEAATVKSYLIVRFEGGRQVSRPVEYAKYRAALDAAPQRVDADFAKAAKELKQLPKPRRPKGGRP